MDYVHILFSNYIIISCIFYFTEQIMDALLLDFIPSPKGEIYTINIAAFTAINKFAIKHGYKMIK